MKKLNFKRVFPLLMLALTASFAGCNTEDVDFSTALIQLTPDFIDFKADGTPVDGNSFDILTNREWSVTAEGELRSWEQLQEDMRKEEELNHLELLEKYGWISLTASEGSGDGKVGIKLLPNTGETRSLRLRVTASINHEFVTIRQNGAIETKELYNIKFGTGAPTASPYPFLDQWIADGKDLQQSGEGYVNNSDFGLEGSGVSLRKSGRLSTGYNGASGENKLFFGSGANLTVKKVASFGASRFKVTFGVAHYANNVNDFTYDKFLVSASADGVTYYPVNYTADPTPAIDAADWYFCSGYVDVSTTDFVYLRFEPAATAASAISLDDVILSAVIGAVPGGPQVTTTPATDITETGATVGGSYAPADATPSALGVEYKKGNEPYVRQAYTGELKTPFTVSLTGLTNGVTYTYRAYATFDGNTEYGSEMTFTAGGGPGPEPGSEIYRINFGKDAKTASPYDYLDEWITAGKDLGQSGSGKGTVDFTNSSAVSLRKSGRLSSGYEGASGENKLFFGANGALAINKIATDGKSDFTITFGVAHYLQPNNDFTYDKLTLEVSGDGATFTPVTYTASPNPAPSAADWYFCTANATVANSGSLWIRFTANEASSLSLDDVAVAASGGGSTTFSFGQATVSGSLIKGTAISGTKIVVPYSNAMGQSYSGVSVAVSGAGSAGISVTQQSSVTLNTGSGQVEFALTGTPTAEGAVSFTISGITELTSPKNTATANVSGGGGSGDEIYRINFGKDAKSSSPYDYLDEWIAASKDLGQSGSGATSVDFTNSTAVSLRKSGRLSSGYEGASGENKLFFGAAANLSINKIATAGKSDFTITFGVAHYKQPTNDFTYDKLTLEVSGDGATFTPVTYTASPNPAPSAADWYFCTATTTVTNSGSLWIRFTANEASSLSLDDVAVAAGGGGTPTFSFGQATFSGSLVKGTAISGAKISVPYSNATGQSYSGVSVAVSGAGSAGISVTQQSSVTLNTGSGQVDFTVTGTPTAEGAVSFTISGITELTNPKNIATANVSGGGTPGTVVVTGDFSQNITGLPTTKPAAGTAAVDATIDGQQWTFYGSYMGNYSGQVFLMMAGKDYTPKAYVVLPVVSGKAIKSVAITSGPSASTNVDMTLQVDSGGNWVDVETKKLNAQSTEFVYTIPSPAVNAKYRFTIASASNYNGQATKIVVTAE